MVPQTTEEKHTTPNVPNQTTNNQDIKREFYRAKQLGKQSDAEKISEATGNLGESVGGAYGQARGGLPGKIIGKRVGKRVGEKVGKGLGGKMGVGKSMVANALRDKSQTDEQPDETTSPDIGTAKKDPAKSLKQRWSKLKAAQRKANISKTGVKELVSSVTSPMFMLTLALAAIKDIIDFLSLGWIGTIVNVAVTTAFIAILLFQGKTMKNMQKRWIRYGIAALAEFIPFISILPFWSGSVIWDKLSKK